MAIIIGSSGPDSYLSCARVLRRHADHTYKSGGVLDYSFAQILCTSNLPYDVLEENSFREIRNETNEEHGDQSRNEDLNAVKLMKQPVKINNF